MAASKRRKGPARWATVALSAMATAGFLVAIVNGPQPKDANASALPAATTAVVSPTIDDGVSTSLFQPTTSVPPATAFSPRFRTGGS